MKEYVFQASDKKSTTLLSGQKEAGKLLYRKSYSYVADLEYGAKTYVIEPKGFWGTTIELKEYEHVLMSFKMNWSGQFIIDSRLRRGQEQFILKSKGFVKPKYTLTDSYERELFTITSRHSWTKTEFALTVPAESTTEPDPVLVLAALYCTKYLLSLSAASAL